MAGYRSVNYYDLCRLCTTSTGPKINIFSNDGKKKNLIQKIGECLPIFIDETDRLPKNICGQCVQQIEAINHFRNSCVNSQAMLEGCLNSSTIQNGGRVYIKDSTGKVLTTTYPQHCKVVNIPKANEVFNPIIQTVDIQQNYSTEMNIKPEEPVSTDISDKQAKHNALAEFLKMKPNIKVTPVKRKQPPQQSQGNISTIGMTSHPETPIMQQHQQHPQIGNKINIQDIKIVSSPNKCLLPITLKSEMDCEQQQIVAHIDAKNLVLPTTYHVQMKLEPKFSTIDGQQVMHLTPTSLPATIQIAPQSMAQTFQPNQQNFQFVSSGTGIDAATSTNEHELVFNDLVGQLENENCGVEIKTQHYSTLSSPSTSNLIPEQQESTTYTVQHINQQNLQIKQVPAKLAAVSAKQGLTISRIVSQHKPPATQQTHMPVPPPLQQQMKPKQAQKTIVTPKVMSNDAQLECNVCGKEFKKKEHLAQHIKLHAGLKPFKCTEESCNKAFSRKEHLMRHIVSHTGKKMFNCEMCHKFFSRKDNLNKHKRTHMDTANTNGQFVCDVCNKSFVVKMYYIQHKLMHEKNGQTAGSVPKAKLIPST